MKRLLPLFAFMLFIISCEDSDIAARKTKINNRLNELNNTTPKDKNGLNDLIHKYRALKEDIISYTNLCNDKGMDKNNDKTIEQIDAVIAQYEQNLSKYELLERLKDQRDYIIKRADALKKPNDGNIETVNVSDLENYKNELTKIKSEMEAFNQQAKASGIPDLDEFNIGKMDLMISGLQMQIEGTNDYRKAQNNNR